MSSEAKAKYQMKQRSEDKYVIIKEVKLYKFIIPWEIYEDMVSIYGNKEMNKLELCMKDDTKIVMKPIDVEEEKNMDTVGDDVDFWLEEEEFGNYRKFSTGEKWEQIESIKQPDGQSFPNI